MYYEQTFIHKCFAIPESKHTFRIFLYRVDKQVHFIHVLLQEIV